MPEGQEKTIEQLLQEWAAWIRFVALLSMITCVVLFLRYCPLAFYWTGVFEKCRIWIFGPLLICPLMWLFTSRGVSFFRRRGLPLYLPITVRTGVILLLGLSILIVNEWAIDWSLVVCSLFLFLWFFTSVVLASGLISYVELWRRKANEAVVALVMRLAESREGGFETYLRKKRSQHSRYRGARTMMDFVSSFFLSRWGSKHCLAILNRSYEENKRRLLGSRTASEVRSRLSAYVRVAEALTQYLALDWGTGLLEQGQRSEFLTEVRRQTITVVLWVGQREPLPDEVTNRLQAWIRQFDEHQPEDRKAYIDFISNEFNRASQWLRGESSSGKMPSISVAKEAPEIACIIPGFQQLASQYNRKDDQAKTSLLQSCAHTSFALAPNALDAQTSLDMWIAMSDLYDAKDLFVWPARDMASSMEPAQIYAERRLTRIYGELRDRSPTGWQAALGGRRDHAEAYSHREIPTRVKNSEGGAFENPSGISSWPYALVWRCPKVKRILMVRVLLFFGVVSFVLAAVNPRLPFFFDWNRVDHVSDRRFTFVTGHTYTEAEHTAMAISENWVALGTTEHGVTLLNKESRIPRGEVTTGAVLDMTSGLAPDHFLVLQDDQSVQQIAVRGNMQANWLKQDLLPAPRNAVWPARRLPTQPNIIANLIDNMGWLVVAEGRGMARYEFSPQEIAQNPFSRSRSWQFTNFVDADVDQAAVTRNAVWIALKGGDVRCADRTTLNLVAGSSVSTPPIERLETSYDHDWVAAIDALGQLWIYPETASIWQGPFFGGEVIRELKHASDVQAARITDNVAWIGIPYGLIAYDLQQRRMASVMENVDARHIFTDGGQKKAVLVAGNRGIYKAETSDRSNQFDIVELDKRQIVDIDIAPDSMLCVYQALEKKNKSNLVPEVCVISSPFGKPSYNVVVPAEGLQWEGLARTSNLAQRSVILPGQNTVKRYGQLQITGIKRFGDYQLFCTSVGAFLYHPANKTYADCSKALVPQSSKKPQDLGELILRKFSCPMAGEKYISAIAEDGLPVILNRNASQTQRYWKPVGSKDAGLRQLVECGPHLIGLVQTGQLNLYKPDRLHGVAPRFCKGEAASLITSPPSTHQFMGDLLKKRDDTHLIGFVHGHRLISYDTADGQINECNLPVLEDRIHELKQVRLVDRNNRLYLLSDGSVLTSMGTGSNETVMRKFGQGAFPFSPDQTVSITSSRPDVMLAGPGGHIVEYNWAEGICQRVGPDPVPLSTGETIEDLVKMRQGLLVVSTEDRAFFMQATSSDTRWIQLPDYRHWTANSLNRHIWAWDGSSLKRVATEFTEPWAPWKDVSYGKTEGLRNFLQSSIFVWQPQGSSKLIFFTGGPDVGVFHLVTENFRKHRLDTLVEPRQFVSNKRGVAVLVGSNVLWISPELLVTSIARLPQNVEQTCLQLDDMALRISFVDDQSVVMWAWDNPPVMNSRQVYSRGGSGPPVGFDTGDVVYAESRNNKLFLIDREGDIASYDPRYGYWTGVSQGNGNHRLYGWMSGEEQDGDTLLFDTGQWTQVASLRKGGLTATEIEILPVSPSAIPTYCSLLENVAVLCDQVSSFVHVDYLDRLSTKCRRIIKPYQREIVRPVDGVLLEAKGVQVVRRSGKTYYRSRAQERWTDMTLTPKGFASDIFEDVVLSGSGQTWALQERGLVPLKSVRDGRTGHFRIPNSLTALNGDIRDIEPTTTGNIRVRYGSGRTQIYRESEPSVLRAIDPPSPNKVAEVNLGQYVLAWTQDVNGHVACHWQAKDANHALPVLWSGTGSLAIHRVGDLMLSEKGELLLATEGGLVVRDGSFGIKTIYPDKKGIRFTKLCGPDRIFLEDRDEVRYQWQFGTPSLVRTNESLAPISQVETGPWTWYCDYSQPVTQRVSIVDQDKRKRQWTQMTPGRWRFQDDIVQWILRDKEGLWLKTQVGTWLYQAGGRRALNNNPPPTRDMTTIFRNAAIIMRYSQGQVTFESFDGTGQPVFEKGRFFFDNNNQICSYNGSLYSLVSSRCVIRRDPLRPSIIQDCWPLPTFPTNQPLVFDATDQAVRLETNPVAPEDSPATGVAYELIGPGTSAEWRSVSPRLSKLSNGGGPISWRLRPGYVDRWEPVLQTSEQIQLGKAGSRKVIEKADRMIPDSWWSRDRFVWDHVVNVGALSKDMIVLVCPVGVLVERRNAGGRFESISFWNLSNVKFCEQAMDEGKPLPAVVLDTADRKERYLLYATKAGLLCTGIFEDAPTPEKAILKLTYRSNSQGRWWISLVEAWQDNVPGKPMTCLVSEITQLPAEALVNKGRFIFDCVASACQLSDNGSLWLTYASAPDAETKGGWLFVNEQRGQSLILRELRRVDNDLHWVRPGPAGNFYACSSADPSQNESIPWIFSEGEFKNNSIKWRDKVPMVDARSSFCIGQDVTLVLPDLRWQSLPKFAWEMDKRCFSLLVRQDDGEVTTSSNYPLFVSRGAGFALSFDIMTSLAATIGRRALAIGSYGGIWVTTCSEAAGGAFDIDSGLLLTTGLEGAMGRPYRVRYDHKGHLLTKSIDSGKENAHMLSQKRFTEITANSWLKRLLGDQHKHMEVDDTRILIAGVAYTRSNDAWGWGRQPLKDIVDIGNWHSEEVLWLCTRNNGLFKIHP